MGSLLGMNSNGGQALTAGSSNTSYYNRLSEIASQQAQTAQSMGLTMSAQGFQSFSKQWSNYAGMNIQGNAFGSAPQVINTPQEIDWLNNYRPGYVPQGVNSGSFFPAPQHVGGGGGFFEDPGGNQLPTPILNPPPGDTQSTPDPAMPYTPQAPNVQEWNGGGSITGARQRYATGIPFDPAFVASLPSILGASNGFGGSSLLGDPFNGALPGGGGRGLGVPEGGFDYGMGSGFGAGGNNNNPNVSVPGMTYDPVLGWH